MNMQKGIVLRRCAILNVVWNNSLHIACVHSWHMKWSSIGPRGTLKKGSGPYQRYYSDPGDYIQLVIF